MCIGINVVTSSMRKIVEKCNIWAVCAPGPVDDVELKSNSNIWYILGKIMGVAIDWDVWLLLMFNSSEWILFVMNSIYYLLIVSGC